MINDQIYSNNLQLLNDNQLKKISKIFNQNEDLSPILRLVLQERLCSKNQKLVKIQIWKKNHINNKIIFITFESLFFLKALNYNLKPHIVYIPLDLISLPLKILKLFSYSFLSIHAAVNAAAACPKASTISTPGITAWPGKCP